MATIAITITVPHRMATIAVIHHVRVGTVPMITPAQDAKRIPRNLKILTTDLLTLANQKVYFV